MSFCLKWRLTDYSLCKYTIVTISTKHLEVFFSSVQSIPHYYHMVHYLWMCRVKNKNTEMTLNNFIVANVDCINSVVQYQCHGKKTNLKARKGQTNFIQSMVYLDERY